VGGTSYEKKKVITGIGSVGGRVYCREKGQKSVPKKNFDYQRGGDWEGKRKERGKTQLENGLQTLPKKGEKINKTKG